MSLTILRRVFPAALETLSYSCTTRSVQMRSLHAAGNTANRFASSSSSTDSASTLESPKLDVNPEFVNRNPRNLERLGIARKSKGWVFQYPPRNFYHRLMFESTNRHITGWVEHCSGRSIITASTKEFAVSKHLYSSTDVSAAQNIGRILAQRCQKAGITCMSVLEPLTATKSQKFQAFHEAVVQGGLSLEEPEEVLPEYTPGIDYDNEWEVQNLEARQRKVKRTPRKTVFKYGQTKKQVRVKVYSV